MRSCTVAYRSDGSDQGGSDTAAVLDTAALAAAIQAVLAARRIDIFGVGAGSIVGLDLQQKLSRIGLTALMWLDSHAALATAAVFDAQCVAVAVSHSGTTTDTVEYLSQARARGATTIALTNFSRSPLSPDPPRCFRDGPRSGFRA